MAKSLGVVGDALMEMGGCCISYVGGHRLGGGALEMMLLGYWLCVRKEK